MGRWLAGYLRKDGYEVVIADKDDKALKAAGQKLGVRTAASNAEAARGADYVLLSVPLEGFEEAVAGLEHQIQANQAVIDITSVKARPVEVMHRYLKEGTVLGAHPLFGPGAKDIARQNFVLTPTSAKEAALAKRVRKYLEERGARIALMTPQDHDEAMSLVLGLSHFIAIAAADTLLGLDRPPLEAPISTTYKVLLTMIESVLSEDPELYASIQMNLPRAVEYERLFQTRAGEWTEMVASQNRSEFIRRFKALKEKLTKVSPDFEKAYENMYRIVEGL